jgi:hypothetical protein
VNVQRKRTILVLVALALLLGALGGCGTKVARGRDPLAGIWRDVDYKTARNSHWLIIAKAPSGYTATLLTSKGQDRFALTLTGDRLSGTVQIKRGPLDVELTYLPASGHLVWRSGNKPTGSPVASPTEFVRFGDVTAVASPQP